MLIVISDSKIIENEADMINKLFDLGLKTFHLRKPGLKKPEFEKVLKAISPEHKRKLVLHQYHELAGKYNIKGLHLTSESRSKMLLKELQNLKNQLKSTSLSFSTSFHNQNEIIEVEGIFDYAFLSPVFDSISKSGYGPASEFSFEKRISKTKTIALGGVNSNNIQIAKEYGFDGVALLGAIWQNPENALKNYEEIQKQYQSFYKN